MATALSTSGAHASAVCLVPTRTWRRAHHEYTVLGDGRDQTGFKRLAYMTLTFAYSPATMAWWIDVADRRQRVLLDGQTVTWFVPKTAAFPWAGVIRFPRPDESLRGNR
jgi:hypothetical protein